MIRSLSLKAQVEFCIGNLYASERASKEIFDNGKNILDQVEAYITFIEVCGAAARTDELLLIGSQFMRKLGQKINRNPSRVTVLREMIAVKMLLFSKNDTDLLHMRAVADPKVSAALRATGLLATHSFAAAPAVHFSSLCSETAQTISEAWALFWVCLFDVWSSTMYHGRLQRSISLWKVGNPGRGKIFD